ncbi:MAG: Urea ABC transporter, permease protein UrtC, partial [uncultured Ramlibacter sp.]
VRVRFLRLPLAHQGRVLLHHHAGADLRGHAAVLPQRDRLRRQQRLHRLQAHPGHPAADARHADGAVRCDRAHAARLLPAGALAGGLQVRPRAAGDPGCRVTGHVLRLQPGRLQAGDLDAVGRDVRGRRCALRAAGRHHQSGRDEPGQLHRDRGVDGGRRTRHAGGPDRRCLPRQRRQELAHRQRAGVLAVLPGRTLHRGDAVPAGRLGRPGTQAAEETQV